MGVTQFICNAFLFDSPARFAAVSVTYGYILKTVMWLHVISGFVRRKCLCSLEYDSISHTNDSFNGFMVQTDLQDQV